MTEGKHSSKRILFIQKTKDTYGLNVERHVKMTRISISCMNTHIGLMKAEWIDYNKDFNEDTAKELMKISDYLLVKYFHTNSDKKIEHIGEMQLNFRKTIL